MEIMFKIYILKLFFKLLNIRYLMCTSIFFLTGMFSSVGVEVHLLPEYHFKVKWPREMEQYLKYNFW